MEHVYVYICFKIWNVQPVKRQTYLATLYYNLEEQNKEYPPLTYGSLCALMNIVNMRYQIVV